MADRFLTAEVQQIGVESTAGTAVTPTVQFVSLGVELDTEVEFDEFAPAGQIVNTLVAPRREWSSGQLSGYPTYTELAYVFSNLFGAATITTPSGATASRLWRWQPDEALPWTPKTWTWRRGDSSTAEEAAYLLLSGLGLVFSRIDAPEVSGDLFARRLDYAAALATTGITSPPLVPVLPSEIDVFMDSASGSLGTTKLLRDFRYELEFSDFFSNMWPLNSSLPSFAAHTITKPELSTTLQLGNDTVGRALITNMRAGSTVFTRLKATSGTLIEASFPYVLQIDSALKVVDSPTREDHEGASVLEWSMRNVYDGTWGKWLDIQLTTSLTGL